MDASRSGVVVRATEGGLGRLGEQLRVLLIEPSDPWVTANAGLAACEQVMYPIGLMYLSGALRSAFADRVVVRIISTIVDCPNGMQDVGRIVRELRPHIVGIRAVMFYLESLRAVVRTVREAAPACLIVVGGPMVSGCNEALAALEAVDVFVEGEGEQTLCEIVGRFMREPGREAVLAQLRQTKGVWWRDDKTLRTAGRREFSPSLDRIALPDYAAIDLEKYRRFLNYGYNRRRMGVLVTSRGCSYACIFCHKTLGRRTRLRSAPSVVEEIVGLRDRYGIRDFCVIDDNFAADRRRVEHFISSIAAAKGSACRFYFPNGIRADRVDRDLIDGLVSIGTVWMTFSAETVSPRLQRLIKKGMDIERVQEAVEHACSRGVITNLCIMVGFPTETRDEAWASLRFLGEFKKLFLPYYFAVRYYPGTELQRRSAEFGIDLQDETLSASYHADGFQETPTLKKKDFEELRYWYLRNVFLCRERLQNCVTIASRHFTDEEIRDAFSLFFRRRLHGGAADIVREVLDV